MGADVDLVLAFLNTLDEEAHTDVLDDQARWHEWVTERHLGEPGDPDHVRTARDALRATVGGGHGELPAAAVQVRLTDGTPVLDADDALGQVLAAAVRLAVGGEWDRVKICPAGDCRWAFYDRSRNRSRTWCSMEVCGNRQKARQFRGRLRGQAPAGR